LAPRNPLIFEGLGLAFLRQGQFDQAIADFDQALKLQPALASALFGRGLAKLKKNENASGEADVSAAKAIKPNVAEELARYGL
jgi:tetratricopeptide (TPR) repeat protein